MELQKQNFDGPIAGQSLTAEVGNRPWQKPPQFTTIDTAIEYYVPKLLDPQYASQLLDVIQLQIPLTTIANAIQVGGVMQGLHTIDVGILVLPVLVETMINIAENAEVEYKVGTEKPEQSKYSSSSVAVAMKKYKDKLGLDTQESEQPVEEVMSMVQKEEPQGPPTTGLMGRSTM